MVEEAVKLILPLLERAPYALADPDLDVDLLARKYVGYCEQAEHRPDFALMERMRAVRVSKVHRAPK